VPTNDHTVPQSYLRRFAQKSKGQAHQIVAAPADHIDRSFLTSVRNVAAVTGFHWGTDLEGVPHHTMEDLMTAIESAAAPAFSAVLVTSFALPARWPPTADVRTRLSWWIAAQIVRTKRQRHRLDYLTGDGRSSRDDAPAPRQVREFSRNNQHLTFIATHLAPLAAILVSKPWGIGFSDTCIATSDAPVILMNGQDADAQLLSVAYWDVILPLDPHRFLIMPTPGSQSERATWTDHRVKLPGGLGTFLVNLVRSVADEQMFWHPGHEPSGVADLPSNGGRLSRPWAGDATYADPEFIIQYHAMDPGTTVERRWLTEHAPPRRGS